MTSLSGGQLTNLRDTRQAATLYASIFQPATILSARVNDGTIVHGDRTIVYDTGSGTFALCGIHQTLWIGSSAGASDKGRIRIKAIAGAEAAGTIIVAENSINWEDDDYLTILHNYEVWPMLPDFTPSTGVFTKDIGATAAGVEYTDENEDTPPVAIAGPHRAREWISANIVFDIDLSNSYPIAAGASIASYSGTIAPAAAGATISVNGGTGKGNVTATQAGSWWAAFVVTDDDGKSQTAYRLYTTEAPDKNVIVNNLQGSWPGGWRFSLDFYGDDDELSDIPDEALCILWYDNKFNGASGFVDIWDADITGDWDGHITYGYLRGNSADTDYNTDTGTVSLSFVSSEGMLKQRTEYGSVDLEAVTTPTKWYQFDATNLTVGTAADHILRWHSTAHLVMDLLGFDDFTELMQFTMSNEGSLLDRVNSVGWQKGEFAYLVSDRLGRLHLVRDSQMQNDTDRTALDTVFTLSALDISGSISMPRNPPKRTILSNLDGASFDSTARSSSFYLAVAPGAAPESQGTGKQKQSGLVLADQTDANEKAGRLHSAANNEFGPWSLNLRGNYLGALDIIPSLGLYVWGLADNTLKRNLPLNGSNLICRSLTHSISNTGAIQTSVTFEVEAPALLAQPETYPSAPGCRPGQGPDGAGAGDLTPGDEAADESAIPPAVLTVFSAAAINKRQFGEDADWVELATDANIEHGKFDPWWPQTKQSYDPAGIDYGFVGAGLVKDATGATGTPVAALPASAAPNTWADGAPPTTTNVDYIARFYDWFTAGDEYFLISYEVGGLFRGWVLKRDSAGVETYLPAYDTGGGLPTESRVIWMAVTCFHVLVTVWQDLATDKLKLLVFDKSAFAFNTEYDLGSTSEAELDAREKWAFPVATPDYSASSPDATAPFIVAGIMVDPVGVDAGTYYALEYSGAWAEIEVLDPEGETEEMFTDFLGSLIAGPADTANGREYWSFRQQVE